MIEIENKRNKFGAGMTNHKIITGLSQKLDSLSPNSIQLVVTSPPYPMIEMWDNIMAEQNPEIKAVLEKGKGSVAFELMHKELDKVWQKVEKVVVPGGIVCINIGDATRTLNSDFALYSNHTRIVSAFLKLGFTNLPNIIWRKQTNAPNKFMGSGMLPPGAYITLEHEWILIFRKGGKRIFKTEEEKQLRRESAYFWEERNTWFSDVWELKGIRQFMLNSASRERSAAFPFELPYRLINMFSVRGDNVLDPFLGTGTTCVAAVISGRNSVGVEVDSNFCEISKERVQSLNIVETNSLIENRITEHFNFINSEKLKGKVFKHFNTALNIEVITSQEVELRLPYLESIAAVDQFTFTAHYSNTKPLKGSISRNMRSKQKRLPIEH